MATMTQPPTTASEHKTDYPSHEYHADAHVLSGHLMRPVEQKIEQHAPVSLKGRRSGHLTRTAEDVSIEGLVTFEKGHTRVSGSKSLKPGHGWVTFKHRSIELFEFKIYPPTTSFAGLRNTHSGPDTSTYTFWERNSNNLQISGISLKIPSTIGMRANRRGPSYRDDLVLSEATKDKPKK